MPPLKTRVDNEASATRARERLSYGWVVAVFTAIAMVVAGNFQYTFGVFVKPLTGAFGWSRAAISMGVSIRNIVTAISSPLIGLLSDRFGPRKFILMGIFLVGSSYLLVSRTDSLWKMYLTLGLMVGMGMSLLVVPAVATVNRWFGKKSALANGIVFSGFGVAQVILPPVATWLIMRYGWETCFVVLGVAAWIVGGIAWSFIRTAPSRAVNPDRVSVAAEGVVGVGEPQDDAGSQYTMAQVLHTGALWNIVIVSVIVAICFQMVMIHIVAAAIDFGIAPAAAAVILTFTGVTNTTSRLTLGLVTGKIGNKAVLVISLAVQAVALFLLVGTRELPVFYTVSAVYGLAYGGIPPLMPTIASSYFGTKSIGPVFGVIVFAYTVGGAIGPFLAGYVFDISGSYYVAFLLAAVAMAAAFLLSLLLRPPKKPKNDYRHNGISTL